MADSQILFRSDLYQPTAVRTAYEEALRICRVLDEAGHTAYFAGGCVRDALLKRTPKDFDVATDATPERVRSIFGRRRTLAFGATFGVIGVLPPRDSDRGQADGTTQHDSMTKVEPTEVATFRSDGEYTDGRRPDQVRFGDAENDALRRDFTINGLFYDPLRHRVIDFVGGVQDLEKRLLRTIGIAAERFNEDKLRMLRAVRFATVLEFELDHSAKLEIRRRSGEVELVSGERIGAEMRRLLMAKSVISGIRLLSETGLSEFVFPESASLELASLDLERLTAAFASKSGMSFPAALAVISESSSVGDTNAVVQSAATRWRLSNDEVRRTTFALAQWSVLARAQSIPWSKLQPILIDRDIETALEVTEALATADRLSMEGIKRCRDAISWPSERLDPAPLINGKDLRDAGFRPGPKFREWIELVRRKQLDDELVARDDALAFVRSLAESEGSGDSSTNGRR